MTRAAVPKEHASARRRVVLVSVILTLGSAVIYGISFPPWSRAVLIWVALVPFLTALARHGPAGGAILGLLWGTTIGIVSGTWFPGMISAYFDQPSWVGWLSLPAVGLAHAGIYCAGFGAAVGGMARIRDASPGRLALAWGGYELCRAHAFGGDPWVLSGYALVHWPTLIQTADLAGPYGLGIVVAAVNASLASTIAPPLRSRRPGRSAAMTIAIILGVFVYGRWQLERVGSNDRSAVMIVQGGVGRDLHWRPEYQRTGLAEHLALSSDGRMPELIVWPEYAVSFYPQEPTPERAELLAGVRRFHADLVFGAPHYGYTNDGKASYHNSVFLIRDGELAARYDKRRLVPFAETSGGTPFSPGTDAGILSSAIGRLGVLVCFEAMYPDLAREAVGAGAQILVNLSNDSWFGSESAARHHLELASLRAVETRRWMLRAATTGYSAAIDPEGRVVQRTEFGHSDVLHANIARLDGRTVYQRFGDAPLMVFLVLTAILAVRRHLLRRSIAAG